MNEIIRQCDVAAHQSQLIELWQRVFGYEARYNAPRFVIDKK